MDQSEQIRRKLREIYEALETSFQSQEAEHITSSLLTGNIGILLFLGYYAKFSASPKVKNTFERYMDHCLELLSENIAQWSYCNGVAGALLGLRHLNQSGLTDIDLEEFENRLKKFLTERMAWEIESGNYDFLHGAIGVAFYLQDAFPDEPAYRIISAYLDKSKIRHDAVSFKWLSTIQSADDKTENVYNISLSHGMSSLVLFFSRLLASGSGEEREKELLDGAVHYILDQEIDPNKYGSYFPSISKEYGISRSRMGWCYGDLGVATALYQAGKARNRREWIEKSIAVMQYAIQRTDVFHGSVNDAGLCHGTAGIAQIFRRFYYYTGEKAFQNCSNYWISVTLQMSCFPDGPAGYQSFRTKEPFRVSQLNMLEGVAGIGLALLVAEGDEFYSGWDTLVLL